MKKLLLSLGALALSFGAFAAVPSDATVLASYYDGNGNQFWGWGVDTFEYNVEEDGYTCVTFTNETVGDPWTIQMGPQGLEFEDGVTYYIDFMVKGTPATGLTAQIQNASYNYLGSFSTYNVTEDWQNVTIKTTCNGEGGIDAIFNFGGYVGTLYMSEVVVYSLSSVEGGVENVIWESDTPVDLGSDWSTWVSIPASQFAKVKGGDNIYFTIDAVSADVEWNQIMMQVWGEPENKEIGQIGLWDYKGKETPFTVYFEISEENLEIIKSYGSLNVGGTGVSFSKIYYLGEESSKPGITIPEGLVLLAAGDVADGTLFVEWSDKMENTVVDGIECVKYTNDTAGDSYSTQFAIDLNYQEGKEYYITFDVMGTPSDVAITAWYQYKETYSALGYSDFNSFKVTSDSEWTPVALNGAYTASAATPYADRVVINLGEYVGTLYMTNFQVYGPEAADEPGEDEPGTGSVSTIEANNGVVVYNLNGVKVLDSANASEVNSLPKGLYIVNGKKVVVK